MKTVDEVQRELADEFQAMGDGFDQYSYLVELSAGLPPLAEEKKTQERAVKGCQSQVWLDVRLENGLFFFAGDSDTLILRGILSLLQTLFNGRPAEEVAGAQVWFFGETEIMATFSADRQKGVGSIIQALQKQAAG